MACITGLLPDHSREAAAAIRMGWAQHRNDAHRALRSEGHAPAPLPPSTDPEMARWAVSNAEAALSGWTTAYAAARAALGAANAIAARYIRAGHDAAAQRKGIIGAALREMNKARARMLAAQRRLAAARVALDDATSTAPDMKLAA